MGFFNNDFETEGSFSFEGGWIGPKEFIIKEEKESEDKKDMDINKKRDELRKMRMIYDNLEDLFGDDDDEHSKDIIRKQKTIVDKLEDLINYMEEMDDLSYKIFIVQPIGKFITTKEMEAERQKCLKYIDANRWRYDIPYKVELEIINNDENTSDNPVKTLGNSIKLMADADLVILWNTRGARECQIEKDICVMYDLPYREVVTR